MEVKADKGPVHSLCPVSEALVMMLYFRPLERHSSSHMYQGYPEFLSNVDRLSPFELLPLSHLKQQEVSAFPFCLYSRKD